MTIAPAHPVQEFMTLMDLNQTQAANELNCASSTISRILKDNRWPTGEMIFHMDKRSDGKINLERCHAYFQHIDQNGETHA